MTFDFLSEQLLTGAIEEFRATEQYKLLREKLNQMDRDCDTNLTASDKQFAEECFELILRVESEKTHYAYHKGLLDSIKLLKWLNVLA